MNLFERIKNIITSPKKEWQAVDATPQTLGTIISSYVVPLALAAAVAAFLGYSFIGKDYGFFRMRELRWPYCG